MSPVITNLSAREVLDCRGLPTVQVDMTLDDGTVATADEAAPSTAADRSDGAPPQPAAAIMAVAVTTAATAAFPATTAVPGTTTRTAAVVPEPVTR